MKKVNVGMRKFANYRIEKKFLIDKEVLIAASKVLYLVYLIREDKKIIEKYDKCNIDVTENCVPKEKLKRLRVIKKMNLEAFYYIMKSINTVI